MGGTSTTKSLLMHLGGIPVSLGTDFPLFRGGGSVWFVDGTIGSDTYGGKAPQEAKATIQAAVSAAAEGDVILVMPKRMAVTDTDPGSNTENVVVTKPSLSIIGLGRGRTQGGLPQLKVGATTTQALLTIRAPGCLIANMGFNGAGATGGGILLDDDGGATKSAFGTTIVGCHFKNCKGTTATNAATGGAIQWGTNGGAWQVLIAGNRFYKNVGDIVLLGTGGSVPQDVVIEDNIFSGPAANVDCNLYLMGGSGMNGVIIRNNAFTAIPALGGTNDKMLALTGCVGFLCGNMFACEDGRTFGAAGNELVPTTVIMAGNFSEKAAAQAANGGDVYRT